MHVRAATVLPLKAQPVVSSSKHTSVEGIDELVDTVVKKPVSDGRVLYDCCGAGRTGGGVMRADEAGQLWPLEVGCTVGKEHSRQTKGVHHGYETTALSEPELPCATQTGGIVQHAVGEHFTLATNHVTELFHCELGIMGVLANIDASCLECTPAHLSVEGKVPEARVPGKAAVMVQHQVLEVVAGCDCILAWSNKVSSTCWEEGGEGTGNVALCGELVDGVATGRPCHSRGCSGVAGLSLLH